MLKKQQLEAAAKVMQALAHPVRLGVLQILKDGEQTVSGLYETLECSQSMMSQQLRILEQQGLISTRKEGTAKFCAIRNPDFLRLFSCMESHLVNILHVK